MMIGLLVNISNQLKFLLKLSLPLLTNNIRWNILIVDLLEFPKTVSEFICYLVAIDHHSECLSAVPLRNKCGATVAAV